MTTPSDLASLFAASERIAFFTGAGISTESGIPDFRSPGGVWSKMQPIQFQDFVASRDARRESWRRVFNRSAGWTGARPNAGHEAVASLIRSGRAFCVVTQNVDNLHQDSGIPDEQVVERFLSEHPEYRVEPSDAVDDVRLDERGYLRVWPQTSSFDGAFAARMRRAP